MSGVEAAMSRVRAIQQRVDVVQPSAAEFEEVLSRHTQAEPASTLFNAAPRPSMQNEVVTLGHFLQPVAPPTARPAPAVAGVVNATELERYIGSLDVRRRNGRLADYELVEVEGGWNGPVRLLPPAAAAWQELRSAASADGVDLRAVDSYRDWETQNRAHRQHLAGIKRANVLPAGQSEHGAGLAVDVTNGSIIDRGDPEWRWLRDHGPSYGWYPISNETWHWEFRGTGA